MRDPRKSRRVPLSMPVLLCTDPSGRQVKGNAVVTDLSPKGLGFETEAQLKSGDLLFLKLFVPVAFACQVRNVKATAETYRCGASIEKIGMLDSVKLRDFVAKEKKKGK
ncbi:MAG: PilZ domain-containing protein [Elusimicrobiota bacterium]